MGADRRGAASGGRGRTCTMASAPPQGAALREGNVPMSKRVCRWLGWALVLSVLTGICGGATAQDGAVVRIAPAAGSYAVGATFAVDVRIEDVADLYGVDIRVAFDPARLQIVEPEVTPGTGLLSPPWMLLFNQVDNEAGKVVYVVTMLNPQVPVSGSGVVFSFHFRTLMAGQAAVDISERTLTDINGELIAATTAGAVYQVEGQGYRVLLPLVLRASSGGQ